MMKKSIFYLMVITIFSPGIIMSCRQNSDAGTRLEIPLLENEKWWGGAVLDGRNSPLNGEAFAYDQFANCKANQAAPLFISNKGRYIWSENPLNIEITKGKIMVEARGGEVTTGKGIAVKPRGVNGLIIR